MLVAMRNGSSRPDVCTGGILILGYCRNGGMLVEKLKRAPAQHG